jgi:hypothetical protein
MASELARAFSSLYSSAMHRQVVECFSAMYSSKGTAHFVDIAGCFRDYLRDKYKVRLSDWIQEKCGTLCCYIRASVKPNSSVGTSFMKRESVILWRSFAIYWAFWMIQFMQSPLCGTSNKFNTWWPLGSISDQSFLTFFCSRNTDYRFESRTGPLSCFTSTNSWFLTRNHQK